MNNTHNLQAALPPMPNNVAHVMRRIRRCESEVPAQLVLEHFAIEYAVKAVHAALTSAVAKSKDAP